MVRSKFVDTPSDFCEEDGLKVVILGLEPEGKAVGVIQVRECSGWRGPKLDT